MAPISFKVNTEYAQMSELCPRLYICGVSALNAANMKAFRIELIVNATREVPNLRCVSEPGGGGLDNTFFTALALKFL